MLTYYLDSNETFANTMSYYIGDYSGPLSLTLCDLNGDTRLDIIVANILSNDISILLGYGNGTFQSQMRYFTDTDSNPQSLAVGDFNNDSLFDIVVVDKVNDNVGLLLAYGNITFGNFTTYPTGNNSEPNEVAVGDFNDDNRLDIVVVNSMSHNIIVLLGCGDGTFVNQITYFINSNSAPYSVAIDDIDNDARIDLVIADFTLNCVYILLGYGNGSFGNQKTYFTGDDSAPYSITIGHFNNGKQLDIVVVNFRSASIGILLGYGNGSFKAPVIYSTGYESEPRSVAVKDIDNDNRADIIVANMQSASIGIFRGTC